VIQSRRCVTEADLSWQCLLIGYDASAKSHPARFWAACLTDRLCACFSHLDVAPIFGHRLVVLLPIVHLFLGNCELRDAGY